MTLKNEALIRAVLDGKKVQYRRNGRADWNAIANPHNAVILLANPNYNGDEFRLSPEPVVTWGVVQLWQGLPGTVTGVYESRDKAVDRSNFLNGEFLGLLKLTHDPETGVTTAEVEKV